MTIHIEERFLSRTQTEGESNSAELVYIAHATADEEASVVKWAVIDHAPDSYDGLVKKTANQEQLAENHYEVAVEYGEYKRPDLDNFSWTFDTTGATQKMTQAITNLGNYAPSGETAPNFHGAINATKDGVAGVDIPSRQYRGEEKFEITYQFSYSPTAYNITAGNIVIPVKRGWDYLWFRYADAKDESAKIMVKRPTSAHLEQVFEYKNFALLGIGY